MNLNTFIILFYIYWIHVIVTVKNIGIIFNLEERLRINYVDDGY